MLLLEEFLGFQTVLINLHMRFDSVYVQKQPVNFTTLNPLGDCPGSLNGGMRAPTKCLVVVQEWWGMNEQIKEQARHIGELGKFVTMVPDLYRGKVAKNSTEAFHLVSNLDYPGGLFTACYITTATIPFPHSISRRSRLNIVVCYFYTDRGLFWRLQVQISYCLACLLLQVHCRFN